MRPPRGLHTFRLATAGIFLGNCIPLGGVIAWGWDVRALIFVYWLEMGIVIFWTSVKILFAQQQQDYQIRLPLRGLPYKRGSITVLKGFPPVYPRNLFTVFLNGWIAVIWFVYGFLTFVLPGSSMTFLGGDALVTTTVGLAAASLVLSRGFTVWTEYFGDHEYETATPGELLREPVGYFVVMGLVFLVGHMLTGEGVAVLLLVVIIAVKTGYDLYDHYRDRGGTWRLPLARLFDDDIDVDTTSVESPNGDPDFETTTQRRTLIVAGIWRSFVYERLLALYPFVALIVAGLAAEGSILVAGRLVAIFLGPLLLVSLVVTLLDYVIGFYGMRYEIHDDAVVGYDHVLEEPQWRIPYREIDDVSKYTGVIGRLLGSSTIRLDCDDYRSVWIPHVHDDEAIYNQLDTRTW